MLVDVSATTNRNHGDDRHAIPRTSHDANDANGDGGDGDGVDDDGGNGGDASHHRSWAYSTVWRSDCGGLHSRRWAQLEPN